MTTDNNTRPFPFQEIDGKVYVQVGHCGLVEIDRRLLDDLLNVGKRCKCNDCGCGKTPTNPKEAEKDQQAIFDF